MRTEDIARVWSAAVDGRSRDLRYRQRQLRCLKEWVTRRANEATQAIRQDLDCTKREAEYILARTLGELREHYDKLNLQEELQIEYSIKKSRTCAERRVAVGIAYIIPEKTTLFYSVLSALYAAIEAGNCCIIEVR
jgi:aldehyde dehydrogenase (NAD+)